MQSAANLLRVVHRAAKRRDSLVAAEVDFVAAKMPPVFAAAAICKNKTVLGNMLLAELQRWNSGLDRR